MHYSSYGSFMRTANDSISTSELGFRVSDEGVARHREALDAVAGTAFALGIRPGAAAALLDRSSPDVVCERAFAVLSVALTGWSADQTEPVVLVA